MIGQALTTFTFDVGWLRRRTDPDGTPYARSPFRRTRAPGRADRGCQSIASDLRPPELETRGLCAALEATASRFTERVGVVCSVACPVPDALLRTLPEGIPIAAYRIVQEALTNVARHAQAAHAWVTVSLGGRGDVLCLEVADDGKGMGMSPSGDRVPLGILGMYERAAECGGSLAVEPRKRAERSS